MCVCGGEGEEVREEKGMRESEQKVSSCRLDQRGTDFINGPHWSGCNQTLISILLPRDWQWVGQEVGKLDGPAPSPCLWGGRVHLGWEAAATGLGRGWRGISPSEVPARLKATLRPVLPRSAPLSGE